jgi:putative membrane protein
MTHTMLYGTRMMGPYMRIGFYGGFSLLMGLACLAILTALILSIIAIVRTSKKRIGKTSTAQNILAERYARGEISSDEFEQMKKDLK